MAGCCRRRCARCRGRGTALRCRRSLRARGRLAGRPHRRMLSRRACREPGAAPCGQGVPNVLAGTQALNSKAPAALGIASPDEFSGEARHMHCYRTQTGGPQHRLVHEPRLPSSGAIAPLAGTLDQRARIMPTPSSSPTLVRSGPTAQARAARHNPRLGIIRLMPSSA